MVNYLSFDSFFVGAWKVPFVYEFGEATYIYVWVARGAYAIMLEMFTFISGFYLLHR